MDRVVLRAATVGCAAVIRHRVPHRAPAARIGGEMERPSWAPEDIDLDRPSGARVYDYFLGGAHNFAADRELAEMIARMTPDIGDTMRGPTGPSCGRAVRFLCAPGIGQFLDIGSGIPTVGNVHEVAHAIAPAARVVYVDIDPVAVSHSRAMLAGEPTTAVIEADARDATAILDHPDARRLLHLDEPVAVLLLAACCTSCPTPTTRPGSSTGCVRPCRTAATWRWST